MCTNCGCGYAAYEDLETGAGKNDVAGEATEVSEA